jgi:predicted dienelactone hydrolase
MLGPTHAGPGSRSEARVPSTTRGDAIAKKLLLATLLVIAGSAAHAAGCDGPLHAGYRVLPMESGRKVAVWYPTAAPEQPFAYARATTNFKGRVARDAPPAACTGAPLVIFSHGLGGCALQSVYITEERARHGYVVAAPDHRDAATCGIDGEPLRLQNLHTDRPVFEPARWTDQSERGRLNDLRAAIEQVRADAALARIADTGRVGAIGHSLGGYAVLALAGAWPSWRTPAVRALVALSPYVAPFLVQQTLAGIAAPVMYQGAEFDWGITNSLEGPRGAFAASAAPKYYVKLRGGTHFEWTNMACVGQASVAACMEARPNVALINAYVTQFFDRYLKDREAPLLEAEGAGLAGYLRDAGR